MLAEAVSDQSGRLEVVLLQGVGKCRFRQEKIFVRQALKQGNHVKSNKSPHRCDVGRWEQEIRNRKQETVGSWILRGKLVFRRVPVMGLGFGWVSIGGLGQMFTLYIY